MARHRAEADFNRWTREAQVQAFLAWLPPDLLCAPGIDWTLLPARVMGYCIRSVGASPDAAVIAMAAAAPSGEVDTDSQVQLLRHLRAFFTTMRAACGMQRVSDLRREALWDEYAAKTRATRSRARQLSSYAAASTKHFPKYKSRVDEAGSALSMQKYQLPPMPEGFLKRVGKAAEQKMEEPRGERAPVPEQTMREGQRAALAQLVPALRELVLLRKLLAERVLAAVREALQQVQTGAPLPIHFQHVDLIPHLNCDAGSPPGGTIRERVAVLRFSLWDKRSWVLGHQDRFNQGNVHLARKGAGAYQEDRNTRFVQFHGPPEDLLWFGELVAHDLLRMIEPHKAFDAESQKRSRAARDLGFPRGCHGGRSGLLDTGDRWFAENARAGELVFEPESLYRGVLFGSALATLALSGGFGVSELLQVSADRWVARGATGGPGEGRGEAGAPGRVHLQSLYPPDARSEGERSLYEVSSEAVQLLEEIKRELEQVHGEVPVVSRSRQAKRLELLQQERYLFQWQGRTALAADLTVLVRFVLHGLRLPNGDRVYISLELLKESAPLPPVQVDRDLKRLRDELMAALAAGLSPSSLVSYQQDLLSYLRFAGSAERAYQPETLAQWIAHLSQNQHGKPFNADAVRQKVTPVRRSMAEAGRRGDLDRALADAFNNIRIQPAKKRGPAPKVNEAVSQWLITQRQARPEITGEELRIAYIREFGKEISTATLYSALAQLHLVKPAPAALTADDERWIVEQCEHDPAITARELRERLEGEREKKASEKELNRIRASHGVRRPRNSPPGVQPQRPASYKLEDADISWLMQRRRENPALSGTQLQQALEEQRGKEIGDRAINAILRKRGLGVGRPTRSRVYDDKSSSD